MIPPEVFALRLLRSGDEDAWRTKWSARIAEDMRASVPVRTGALRASIRTDSEGVVVGASYAAYVEYGTSHMAPQPFAGPSLHRNIRPAVDDAGKDVIRQLTT
jgi:HK97 gp10 family phage protein